jgi:Ca2+-binding EF-hand superfamily protein
MIGTSFDGASRDAILQALKQQDGKDATFEDFVAMADKCREVRVAATQKMAGFSESEIKHLQELFHKYDKEKRGDISENDIQILLHDLGMECKTLDERRAVLARLDEARAAAREAATTDELQKIAAREPSAENPSNRTRIDFWEAVQFVRLLRNEKDQIEDRKMEALRKELNFSAREVSEFREIFLTKARDSSTSKASTAPASARSSAPASARGSSSLSFLSRAPANGEGGQNGLSTDSFCALLRSLGVNRLSSLQKQELQWKIAQCNHNKDGDLDFTGFLQMMRWLLDRDFAEIKAKTAIPR